MGGEADVMGGGCPFFHHLHVGEGILGAWSISVCILCPCCRLFRQHSDWIGAEAAYHRIGRLRMRIVVVDFRIYSECNVKG